MAEAKPLKQPANRSAMRLNARPLAQCNHQGVQRQVALLGNPRSDPVRHIVQFAMTGITLSLRCQCASLPPKLDHIVHKRHRYTEVTRRRLMRMTFIHKRYDALAKLNRMWFAQLDPQYL